MKTKVLEVKATTTEYIEWDDIVKAVEALLSEREGRVVDIRDYNDKYKPGGDMSGPYQDFWHFWIQEIEPDMINGFTSTLYWNEMRDVVLEYNMELGDDHAKWVLTIYDAIGELLTPKQREEVDIEYSW